MIQRTHHALPEQELTSLAQYEEQGGLRGLHAASSNDPGVVIRWIADAGVRGRGGAGFPTAVKWQGAFSQASVADDAFVVVNAAEGEPGTFKDRALLVSNPYVVLEGALIAARVLHADRIVVATKASYRTVIDALAHAIGEFAAAGLAHNGDHPVAIDIVEGPDHYLFGEETALLEVIEGEDPLPRHLPPYQYGLFTTSPQLGWSAGAGPDAGAVDLDADVGSSTLVNNVETYAHVALVCRHGADWYRSMGTDASPGPTIVTITGDVRRAEVAEIALGPPLADVIAELGGGPLEGRAVKAVLSGVANGALGADLLDTPVTYEHLDAVGGGLGSAGFVVYDDRRNMIDVAARVSRFLHVESCGQCNACKGGTRDVTVDLETLVAGDATPVTLERIANRIRTVTDAHRCYLPVQEQRVVTSMLQRFGPDLDTRLLGQPGDPAVPIAKIVDIVDGVAVLDERIDHKRPDWTYSETPVTITER